MRYLSSPTPPSVPSHADASCCAGVLGKPHGERNTGSVYAGVPMATALGVGGASALACRRRTGFDTLATVVAVTTLLMAGASVYKLLPRRRTEPFLTSHPIPTAPEQPAPQRPEAWDVAVVQKEAL